jgi:dipeptidyl aminopeptidase/acylaminoacyl peptidase
MSRRPAFRTATAVAALTLLAGCSDGPSSDTDAGPATATTSAPPDPTGSQTASPTAGPGDESTEPDPTSDLPPVRHPTSLAALMRERLPGGAVRRERRQFTTDAYARYEVTYPSGDLRISGILLVPTGKGPFPAVVLNHGYIEPSVYVTGQGLSREQDYLARAGFVVLHTDYRGHAASDPATPLSRETRLGYTRDTINAVQSLKKEAYVDPDRVAMLGRSMGGGVTLNALVAKPGLVKAGVVFASVSSRFLDNFDRWTRAERPDAAAQFFDEFGTPREEPGFYRGLSARAYFDRITAPVLMHHGTLDDSCPIAWSRTTQGLLRDAGVRSRLDVYDGEQHAFGPQWPESMRRTVAFLRRELRA